MKNEKKKFLSTRPNFFPENIANAAKKRFLRFWTWDSKNGGKVSLGTTLDDLYKEVFQDSCFVLPILANPWYSPDP
jgi:hypothetical protein